MYEAGGRPRHALPEDEKDEGEDIAAANAGMLLDFIEVMRTGVYVQARSSFAREVSELCVVPAVVVCHLRGTISVIYLPHPCQWKVLCLIRFKPLL